MVELHCVVSISNFSNSNGDCRGFVDEVGYLKRIFMIEIGLAAIFRNRDPNRGINESVVDLNLNKKFMTSIRDELIGISSKKAYFNLFRYFCISTKGIATLRIIGKDSVAYTKNF